VVLQNHFVFVNLHRGRWLAPLRPESVYDQVAALKTQARPGYRTVFGMQHEALGGGLAARGTPDSSKAEA
jgi:hypothetical protein